MDILNLEEEFARAKIKCNYGAEVFHTFIQILNKVRNLFRSHSKGRPELTKVGAGNVIFLFVGFVD